MTTVRRDEFASTVGEAPDIRLWGEAWNITTSRRVRAILRQSEPERLPDAGSDCSSGDEHSISNEEIGKPMIVTTETPAPPDLFARSWRCCWPFLFWMRWYRPSGDHEAAATPATRWASSTFRMASFDRSWLPKGEGADFEFNPTMKALEPYRDRTAGAEQSGPDQRPVAWAMAPATMPARARPGSPACIRRRRKARTFTPAFRPTRSPRASSASRPSSRRSKSASKRRASPAVAIPVIAAPTPTRFPGAARRTPNPMEVNPRVLFERLFGDGDSTDTPSRA